MQALAPPAFCKPSLIQVGSVRGETNVSAALGALHGSGPIGIGDRLGLGVSCCPRRAATEWALLFFAPASPAFHVTSPGHRSQT